MIMQTLYLTRSFRTIAAVVLQLPGNAPKDDKKITILTTAIINNCIVCTNLSMYFLISTIQ